MVPPQISFLNSMLIVAPASIFPPFMTVNFEVDLTSSSSLPSATPFFELHVINACICKKQGSVQGIKSKDKT